MRVFALAMAALVGAFASSAPGGIADIAHANGSGGVIPGSGTGGGGDWDGGNANVMPHSPFESSVMISGGVASVHSISFNGLVHGFMGDLHAVLFDPDGNGHNIFVRPGVGFNSSIFGSGSNFDGDYIFIESGAANDLPTATGGGATTIPGGEYNQTFAGSATAMGSWEHEAHNIHNTPLSQISGGAGQWTLRIYDWTGGDAGSLDSWKLTYTPIIPAPATLGALGLLGLLGARRRRS